MPISSKWNQWIGERRKRHGTDQRERSKGGRRVEGRERGNRRRKRRTRSDESPRESGFQLSWSSHVIARACLRQGRGGDEKDPDWIWTRDLVWPRSFRDQEARERERKGWRPGAIETRFAENREKLWTIISCLFTRLFGVFWKACDTIAYARANIFWESFLCKYNATHRFLKSRF